MLIAVADDPDAVEAADQVDRDHLLEGIEVGGRVVGAVLADGALCPTDAGRVDQHANRPHALGHLHRVDDVVGVGDVDLAVRAADLVGQRRPLLLLQVGHDDLGTPRGQHACCRAPIPDAPPVTIALTPLISMKGDDNADVHGDDQWNGGAGHPYSSKSER